MTLPYSAWAGDDPRRVTWGCTCFSATACTNATSNETWVGVLSPGAQGAWHAYRTWTSTNTTAADSPGAYILWGYEHGVPGEHVNEIMDHAPDELLCEGDREMRGWERAERALERPPRWRNNEYDNVIPDLAAGLDAERLWRAELKADVFLRDVLSEDEYATLEAEHRIDIEAWDGKIRVDDDGQIALLDKRGEVLSHLCVIFPTEAMPKKDQVASKVLMAKYAPERLLLAGKLY